MTKNEWNKANMRTLSCRVRKGYYERLKAIADAEDVSIHRIIINLLDRFMDEYEKGD